MIKFFTLFVLLINTALSAQDFGVIKGVVKDLKTEETLPFAAVKILANDNFIHYSSINDWF